MGQKSDPRITRMGITTSSSSNWYASKKNFADFLHEDITIEEYIEKKYKGAEIANIFIKRPSKEEIEISIHCHKVGMVLGRRGEEVSSLKNKLEEKIKDKKINIKIFELRENKIEAKILGEMIADAIEKRVPYKKAGNQALNRARKLDIKGIKILISGRLNGAEIARDERFTFGKVPLHTLRYKIDYALVEARTISGIIGIKVWVSEGEILDKRIS